MTNNTVPYDEIDAPVVQLVRVLNEFPCVKTLGSCGGHEVTTNPSQWAAGTFYVSFEIQEVRRGWRVLEMLAWAINNDYSSPFVRFIPLSAPPFLNDHPVLHYAIEGYNGESADDVAAWLIRVLKDYLL